MCVVITSVLPFAPISWWALIARNGKVCFDTGEHFQKMTYRNKYQITGANGPIKLSIPLAHGREQRTPMAGVAIDNSVRWQVQHWRTLVSVYNRSPYFEFYQPSLQLLFEQQFHSLVSFNMATVHWLKKQLKLDFDESVLEDQKEIPEGMDIRRYLKQALEKKAHTPFPVYYQLFEERNGFLPNLSILDLLFSKGPETKSWLEKNNNILLKRMEEMMV